MKKNQTTVKKVKVKGHQEYVNTTTGETESFQVISMEERDFNFHKLWLGHIISSLDAIGNQKIKVLTYVLENANRDNILISGQKAIATELNVSRTTVSETFKLLIENELLKKISNNVYMVNPNVIFKGTKNNRLNVLLQYQGISTNEQGGEDDEEGPNPPSQAE